MKRLIVMAIFALVFITTSAHAADKGMYVSGNLGISLLSDSDVEQSGFPTIETSFDLGFNIGGAIGYDYGNIRAEGEIAYRLNDIDEFAVLGFIFPGGGDVSALSFMVNGYYDLHSANSPLVPYLGLGVGFANVMVDASVGGIPLLVADDDDLVFAYQFMAGIGYEISPTTALTVGYRYFQTSDASFSDPGFPDVEAEIQSHEFNFGVRVMF